MINNKIFNYIVAINQISLIAINMERILNLFSLCLCFDITILENIIQSSAK